MTKNVFLYDLNLQCNKQNKNQKETQHTPGWEPSVEIHLLYTIKDLHLVPILRKVIKVWSVHCKSLT